MTVTDQAPATSAMAKFPGWRSVLVHVEPTDAAAPRLAAALALARRFDAQLIGMAAQYIDPRVLGFGPGVGEAWADLSAQHREDMAAAAERFRAAVGSWPSEFRSVEDKPADALARAARAADVIVAGGAAYEPPDDTLAANPAELAIASGRPVLVAPSTAPPLIASRIVVAWKESREARRAVADALPLLRRADKVTVVEVCRPDEVADAEFRTGDVAAALRRHGAPAEAKAVAAPEDEIAVVLAGEAAAVGADLMVAGCYGRTRLGEWVFGGVSRDLLRAPDRYLLISH